MTDLELRRARRRVRRFSFENPWFLAGKGAVASALALIGVTALGIDDHVTAAFVAVLCCSPAVSIGLHQGIGQLVGSLLGGTLGTVALALGLPVTVGVPLAVGPAMLTTHLLGQHRAVAVAAFTALFVQLVPFGGPLETWATRQAAVVVACLAGAVVNIIVSAAFYPSLFTRRLERVEGYLDDLIEVATASGDLRAVRPGFRVLEALAAELASARRELELRRAPQTAALLADFEHQVEAHVRRLNLLYASGAPPPPLSASPTSPPDWGGGWGVAAPTHILPQTGGGGREAAGGGAVCSAITTLCRDSSTPG